MELFRDFLKLVRDSVYSPEFYKGLPDKRFWFSFKYFYSLVLVLALIVTALISLSAVPETQSFLNRTSEKVLNYYPQELEITIQKGQASTNVTEPYFLKLPDEFKTNQPDQAANQPENLLVIDTTTPFSVEKFKDYKTLAMLTKDNLVFAKDREIRIYGLDRFPDMKISKAAVSNFVAKVRPFLKFAGPVVVLGLFLIYLIVFSSELFFLLFIALGIWIILKIRKMRVGYVKGYQIGLHAVTLGMLLEAFQFILGFNITIPFLFTILTLLVVVINFGSNRERASQPETA